MFDAAPDVFADKFFLFVTVDKFLERAGHGADAAFDFGGQEVREQIEKQVCVSETFRRSPIR